MKNANIVPTNYLDVLFLDKNKAYGAYQLRSNYDKVATKALVIFFTSIIFVFGVLYLNSAISIDSSIATVSAQDPVVDDDFVHIQDIVIPKPVEVKQLGTITEAVKTISYTTPKIAKNNQVQTSDLINNPIDASASISDQTNPDGVEGANQMQGLADGLLNGNSLNPNAETEVPEDIVPTNTIFNKVDIKASAPYDINAYVSKYLRYPEVALANEIEGRVMISFIVELDGSVSNVKLIGKDIGGGCSNEAIRVIKKLPKWMPAKINGKAVRSYFQYPINFTLTRNN